MSDHNDDPIIRDLDGLIRDLEERSDKTGREAMEMLAVTLHGLTRNLAGILGGLVVLAQAGRVPNEAAIQSAQALLRQWKITDGQVQQLIDAAHFAKQQ